MSPITHLLSLSSLLLLLLLLPFAAVSGGEDCVYTLYIRTGSIIKGGTNSIITVRLYDGNGYYLEIPNIETWGGLMGANYDYFERGNLDIFSGKAPCLTAPICALNLTSDGTGRHPGWYVNYVETTLTGVHRSCTQEKFTIEQWLSKDASPYQLTAIRNYCSKEDGRMKTEEAIPISSISSVSSV